MKDNRNFKPNNKKNNFKKFDNKPKTNNKKVQEKFPKRTEEKEESFSDQIEGRNSVLELLESGKDINKIFIEKGEKQNWDNRQRQIFFVLAKINGITKRNWLKRICLLVNRC